MTDLLLRERGRIVHQNIIIAAFPTDIEEEVERRSNNQGL